MQTRMFVFSDYQHRQDGDNGDSGGNRTTDGWHRQRQRGSGGSGMECLQLRSQPEPFHYLISEQAKSLVALQELQNEVGALLEFRDLVIETFPNLRSKMAPSTPASGTRRDWEPGVRVRRKLAGGGGDATRAKPQPSVQDSGFSTETSCGKDAQSSSATRSRPLEDELWALLDVIQRKGVRLRDEAELLRGELDERPSTDTAEESFARALSGCGECSDVRRLRSERDALLSRTAQLEAEAASSPERSPGALGRLDDALDTPSRPPRVLTPDSKKFAAILQESNPVELQRQLLSSTVQNQVLREWMSRAAKQRSALMEKLEQATDLNEDLKFRLEEKSVELDSVKTRVRQLERACSPERRSHSSMRDMEPLQMPPPPPANEDSHTTPQTPQTPRRRPSRIPLHKPAAPKPPKCQQSPPRPPSALSGRSASSARSRPSLPARRSPAPPVPAAPHAPLAPLARRTPPQENKRVRDNQSEESGAYHDSLNLAASRIALAAEYLARTEKLAHAHPLFSRLSAVRARPQPANLPDYQLAYESPQNLALELSKSILYENADSIDVANLKSINSHGEDSLWNGKPQQYFESMNYAENDAGGKEYDSDSLAP